MHTINKKSIPLPTTAVCRRADSRGQGKNMQDQTQTTSSLPSSSERSSSSAPQTEEAREGTRLHSMTTSLSLSLCLLPFLRISVAYVSTDSVNLFKHACASVFASS